MHLLPGLRPRTTAPASDATSPASNSGLSGRSLIILVTFICVFTVVVAFALARRHTHTRSLARANASKTRRRSPKRPQLSEVCIPTRTNATNRGTWQSMQPLSARVVEPGRRVVRHSHRYHAPSLPLVPPSRSGPNYLSDYNAVIGDSWFGGRNMNEIPSPMPVLMPHPPPPRRRREPTMHVAVLIAMPRPPSPDDARPRPPPQSSSSSTDPPANNHPPDPHPDRNSPPDVALGLARVPWHLHEQPALWSVEGMITNLA